MISFEIKSRNQLLLNPKMSDDEKTLMFQLKAVFEKEFGLENYILVTSSGSSKNENQSAKLIALKVTRILNSANRVNHLLKATHEDTWGMVLPEFHVAGIGILARAYLVQSKVITLDWDVTTFKAQLEIGNVKYLSLVPTQVFDLVKAGVAASQSLKAVFVGGGALNPETRKKFVSLGWPVVETYGMTETASMIATKATEGDLFTLMDNVDVKIENQGLAIHADSLLTASLQKIGNNVRLKYYDDNSWFQSDDQAEIVRSEKNTYLKFLGRGIDYIKILGEGVSLIELRALLSNILQTHQADLAAFEIMALNDNRNENKLVLIAQENTEASLRSTVFEEFNKKCRPYEKISAMALVKHIPRTDLGKLKLDELKRIISEMHT